MANWSGFKSSCVPEQLLPWAAFTSLNLHPLTPHAGCVLWDRITPEIWEPRNL